MNTAIQRGTVRSFNPKTGYGFIAPDGAEDDAFVHHIDVNMGGFRSLLPGQRVEFELLKTDRGQRAMRVRVVQSRELAPAVAA
jgi:cold shock protein